MSNKISRHKRKKNFKQIDKLLTIGVIITFKAINKSSWQIHIMQIRRYQPITLIQASMTHGFRKEKQQIGIVYCIITATAAYEKKQLPYEEGTFSF